MKTTGFFSLNSFLTPRHPKSQHLLMLFVYPKNERPDLTAAQKRALRKIVETEYP
jgi:hypothetical protein